MKITPNGCSITPRLFSTVWVLQNSKNSAPKMVGKLQYENGFWFSLFREKREDERMRGWLPSPIILNPTPMHQKTYLPLI